MTVNSQREDLVSFLDTDDARRVEVMLVVVQYPAKIDLLSNLHILWQLYGVCAVLKKSMIGDEEKGTFYVETAQILERLISHSMRFTLI